MAARLPFDPVDRLLLRQQIDRTGSRIDRGDTFDHPDGRLRPEDVGRRIGPIMRWQGQAPAEPTRRQVMSWRKAGIDLWLADRIACAIGWPATLIWDDYDDLMDAHCDRVLARMERRAAEARNRRAVPA